MCSACSGDLEDPEDGMDPAEEGGYAPQVGDDSPFWAWWKETDFEQEEEPRDEPAVGFGQG
jgi:hypothetical protein